MSDLVKRLRKYANMPYSGPIHDTCGEAADEIERLNKVVDAAKAHLYRPEFTGVIHTWVALHEALAAAEDDDD